MSQFQTEPLLAMDNIQGNILEGFNKPFQRLLAYDIGSPEQVKRWLRQITPWITTAKDVHGYRVQLRMYRKSNKSGVHKEVVWMNIAFSWPGLRKLAGDLASDAFSQAFTDGQWKRATSILGDPEEGLGSPITWEIGGSEERVPDILLLLAADREDGLEVGSDDIKELFDKFPGVAKAGLKKIWVGEGKYPQKGIEHFGFADGIAHPCVRGRLSNAPNDYLFAREPPCASSSTWVDFTSSCQQLVWPGQFLLGYPTQSLVDARRAGPPCALKYDWLKDGSYLVFRRLAQNVAAFRDFVKAQTRPGENEEYSAARLMGRWKNGMPLALFPGPTVPQSEPPVNAFGYLPDIQGDKCPVAAHIRKVNPRDQGTNLGPPAETLSRLLLRRGIPYGRPYDEAPAQERGFLFLSYQASIEDTFETVMQNWIYSTAGPTAPPSTDSLLRRRKDVEPFVYATGGGYFFVPSLHAIKYILSHHN